MNKIRKYLIATVIVVVLAGAGLMAGQGGPDQTGYRWVDSDEAWGPEYEWVDITETGTLIDYFPMPEPAGPYNIGFDFPFYDGIRNQLWVCSFGYLLFEDDYESNTNDYIPNDGSGDYINYADNFIAMFWDSGVKGYWPERGDVYYYNDVANNRFIVSYIDIPYPYEFNGSLNFQAILNADGTILLQYGTMDSGEYPLYGATVGIENEDGTDGLQVVFGTEYIHSDMAILLYREPLHDYDVAPLEFTSPYGPLQVPEPFTPIVTFDNLGAQAADFNVNLTILYDGSSVYNEDSFVNALAHNDQVSVEFPEFVPDQAGTYTLTATSMFDPDENILNNTKTVDIEVWSEHLPPVELTGINSQNSVAPVYWFEPDIPPCTLVAYDDGAPMNGGIEANFIQANEFEGMAPSYLCTAYVHVSTSGDLGWPWPFGMHTEGEVKVFGDANGDGIPDTMLANVTAMPEYGEWITHVFEPPLVITSDKFWIGYNMVEENYPPADLLTGDDDINYINKAWYRDADGNWHNGLYGFYGDRLIRAAFRTHTANTMLTEDVEAILLGYNLYRSTEPGVPLDEAHRILDLTTEVSYNDEDVTNGTTYYYVATAVYEGNEGNIESAPSNEIPVRPAQGGELTVNVNEISVDSLPGNIYTSQLILTNDGDIDVEYTIVPSVKSQLPEANGDPDNYGEDFLDSFAEVPAKFYYDADQFEEKPRQDIPVIAKAGGPDEYGYYWIDSDDPHGPEYAWIDPTDHDIVTVGGGNMSNVLDMACPFTLYGNTFRSLRVSLYGYISFTSEYGYHMPYPLPGVNAPENMIAPFWEFLSFIQGYITYHTDSSMTVITWNEFQYNFEIEYPGELDPYTFQLILYPDGQMVFQYHTMGGPPASNTIGVQNETMDVGLMVSHLRPYAHAGLATMINTQWLHVDSLSGIVPAGGSVPLNVSMDATSLQNLLYQGNIYITSNDVNVELDPIDIPVSLDLMTGISDDDNSLPNSYSLSQNYPNPFNATTTIQFSLKNDSEVKLSVYDILGREIRTLQVGTLNAGTHNIIWDGTNESGEVVSSGVYFYRLECTEYSDSKRMMLLK